MAEFLDGIGPLALWVARSSLQASVLVALILAGRWLLGPRLAPRWRSVLWGLVLVRLAMPAAPSSALSLFNLLPWTSAGTMERTEAQPPVAAAVAGLHVAPPAVAPSSPPSLADEPAPAPPARDEAAVAPVGVQSGGGPDLAGSERPAGRPWRYWAGLGLRAFWLAGAAVLLGRLAAAALVTRVRLRGLTPLGEPQFLALLEDCRRTMRLRRRPRVVECGAVAAPALAGVLRPTVLLPDGAAAGLSRRDLRYALLHELAHLRRGDVPVQWLAALLGAAHWFNPLIWLARRWMRADRELACDQMVLCRVGPDHGLDYGRAIVNLLERLSGGAVLPGAVGVLEDARHIRRRITMIATHRRPTRGGAILGGLLLALLGTVALTNAQADRRGPAGGADANLAPQPKPWVRSLQGSGSNPDDAKIAAAMGKRLAEARFDKIELKAVIDWFRQVTEVNLVVDWAALEAAGIQATAPVKHIDLKNVPAGRALQAVLDDAGGSSTRLTFTIDDGVLLVSTPEALAGYDKRATKVYDVRAILAGRPVSEGEGADYTQAVAELIRTIQDQVDPTSWRGDAGGDIGQISVNYGQLVVTQTLQNHRRMEALLESLLEARVPKWKRDIHERLQKPIPKVDLAGVEFAAALDFIRQQTGLNIVVAPGAYTSAPVLPPGPAGPVGMPGGTMGRAMAPDGSVGVPGAMTGAAVAGPPPITLKVQNLTAQQVLSLIVRMAGMRWDLVDGAVYVSASAPVGVGPALPPDMLAPPVMPGASPYGPSYR